ncbi:MAG: LytTR family DNA-binding domain-containing protein [Perlabentimonas sp.]
MKISIIIIDDEKDAVEAIENSLKLCDINLEIIATTTNPLEGVGLILKHKPDVVFLDIEMPQLSGFELLDSIPEINFEIIFATAYEHYAIQAIKNNAADYILKPVSITDIKESLNKVTQRISNKEVPGVNYKKLVTEVNSNDNRKLKINSCSGFELVNIYNIISVEAQGVYSVINSKNREQILITKPLKEIEALIGSKEFFRSHRSFLINLHHVKKYDSEKNLIVMSDNSLIHLARRRKEEFKKLLNGMLNK